MLITCDGCGRREPVDVKPFRPPPCRAVLTWLPEEWGIESADGWKTWQLACGPCLAANGS